MTNLYRFSNCLEILVQQTNIYAGRRSQSENVSRNSRLKQWRPVNLAEMKVFLAIIISMGLVQKSDVQDYWSTDEVQDTPFFRKHDVQGPILVNHE